MQINKFKESKNFQKIFLDINFLKIYHNSSLFIIFNLNDSLITNLYG